MIKGGSTKGLSTIVATLLIILLTLVAVGVVWIVVRSVIQENSERIMLGRLTVDLEISRADIISFTDISVIVKRNPGRGELSGIVFIAYNTDDSEAVRRNVSMEELEEQDFRIILTVLNASNVKKIAIAPIFITKSGKEFIGDIEDEWIFSKEIILPVCGDGALHYTEECDDGDTSSGDGCSQTCTVESGWDCWSQPSVCEQVVCGDGIVHYTEACDDGDTSSGDGCSQTCTVESGYICTGEPSVCAPSGGPGTNYIWTGELLLNGGFELGTLNYWNTPSGPEFAVTNTLPQSGNYSVYYQAVSSINYVIQQDVDLTPYAIYIDAGTAVINATGYGISSEYPGHDVTRIQIIFLNSGKGAIGVARDTGYISSGTWWKDGALEYNIPVGTRYVRVWGNTYDPDGTPSGGLDSFSVRLGYPA